MTFVEGFTVNESCVRFMIKRNFLYVLILNNMLKLIIYEFNARKSSKNWIFVDKK